MKIMLKGILAQEDAKLAADYGTDGIIVSNHSGPSAKPSRCKTRTAFGAILMAAADLFQFRRLLVDIDLEFGGAATTPAAARPGMSPPITAIRSGGVNGSLSPASAPAPRAASRSPDP